jgi:hypothetical protein
MTVRFKEISFGVLASTVLLVYSFNSIGFLYNGVGLLAITVSFLSWWPISISTVGTIEGSMVKRCPWFKLSYRS